MIISINAETTFDKTYNSFINNTQKTMGRMKIFKLTKDISIHLKLTPLLIMKDCMLSTTGSKMKVSASIQHHIRSLNRGNKTISK